VNSADLSTLMVDIDRKTTSITF